MAAKSFSEEDLSCTVCCDIFKDPVVLPCSHSFCRHCLQTFWETKGCRECPVCRRISTMEVPLSNLALKNLCETISQERSQAASAGSEVLCSLHGEKLKLFCLDDKMPVCLVCRDSVRHTNHRFRPLAEAALQHKDEVRAQLKPLLEKVKVYEEALQDCETTARHIKMQAEQAAKQINDEFEVLHQFLRDEEAARIDALWEEEEQKSQMMKERMENVSREMSSLSDTIRAVEEEMEAEDVTFLQLLANAFSRAKRPLQDLEECSGALIHVARHLGNLKHWVWLKMQHSIQYTPVVLNPNTAHPDLILSEDLSSLRASDQSQQLPDNPERFDYFLSALGSEGFSSGAHCWEVEVGNNAIWQLGVMAESARRKGDVKIRGGLWRLGHSNGKYTARGATQPETAVKVSQMLQKIRVTLDWDRGKVSFSDPVSNTHLHTLMHHFTERVFPYFNIVAPFRILPAKINITVGR
ncbi:zinc-binding protein A33-like isoform X2 [Denticeps clupeoides]|uniref:zinc-binding protein A33-like isoform X2 n=1 Tax=Denticeps clupeoides TaxID=299321 RepID=UPI0010A3E253|nr:zinc-binding protein A33-like isoform X2 [Denticeps clupeoides]